MLPLLDAACPRTRVTRVLYVNSTSVHGGAEEALLRLMEAAVQVGYEPSVLLPGTGWLADEARVAGYEVGYLPTLPDPFVTLTAAQQRRHWLRNAVAIARHARRAGAGIVHSNSPRTSYHAGLGARVARIPAVTHVHDIIGLPLRSLVQRRLLAALGRLFLGPSQATADAVTGLAPELSPRVRVIYNGWDRTLYDGVEPLDVRAEFGFPADAVVVGNVAAMYPWKGQDVLIESVGLLLDRHPRLRLLVVGGGQGSSEQAGYEQSLRERVRRDGLEGRVILTGWRQDSWAIIQALDVFCHLPTRPDPLPTAVIHAAALGRPIIGSRIGGIPEILGGEAGVLVRPGDPKDAAAALEALLADPERRSELGRRAAARFSAVFSAEVMRRGLAGAYATCLGRTS
jgi:glycosyltransferase involved in cell wall biosynthesis